MDPHYIFCVDQDNARLDVYLTSQLPNVSRTMIQKWIHDHHVSCNNLVQIKTNFKVQKGMSIEIFVPEAKPSKMKAQNILLNIVFENDDLLVIDKPAGLVVHPAPGHCDGTLVNALLNYCSLSSIGGVQRPGIVHRLDKDTSGLMVVAKNDKTHQMLSSQFHDNKTLLRIYHAWVWTNKLLGQGVIETMIGRHPKDRQKMAVVSNGKKAITNYFCEERITPKVSRLRLKLLTGRTHQIRVHCLSKGWPIVGDPIYGKKQDIFNRQALHASSLSFLYNEKEMFFQSPFPKDLTDLENALKSSQDDQ
jgi:23S rRNA pseudouridine1911/1915/1917 synthase